MRHEAKYSLSRSASLSIGVVIVALLILTAAVSYLWTPYPPAALDIPIA